MYEIVWEFQPALEKQREFESTYGPTGPWAALFGRDPGYRGTELIPPNEPGGWYRTIDRWESPGAFERFRQTWAREYDALDRTCESLMSAERLVKRESGEP